MFTVFLCNCEAANRLTRGSGKVQQVLLMSFNVALIFNLLLAYCRHKRLPHGLYPMVHCTLSPPPMEIVLQYDQKYGL